MKFALSTTKLFYADREEIARLVDLGFTFQPVAPRRRYIRRVMPMRIAGRPAVSLATMKALLNFIQQQGGRVELRLADHEIVLLND